MTRITTTGGFGQVADQTLTIERLLPGTVDRVWAYLTDSELRRKWLAAGDMVLEAGAPFELVWRNDELTRLPGVRPAGFAEEGRMESEIVAIDPPHSLTIAWGQTGGVTISLEQQGKDVKLTLVHRRVPSRDVILMLAPGWHVHLDILRALLAGDVPPSFWDSWLAARDQYDQRLAG